MSTSLFNRTVKTNIVLYKSNGDGRDTYITHNNGGFWKEETCPLNTKEVFYHKPINVFHSWNRTPPIWSYHSDGSGRDYYVSINNGGLMKKFRCMNDFFKNILRKNDDIKTEEKNFRRYNLSKNEKIHLKKINKIQRDLVNRLYNSNKIKYRIQKLNIRNKILSKDKIQIDGSFSKNNINSLNNENKKLIKSSSQILKLKNKYLEPINNNKNNYYENLNLNGINSTNNIFAKRINYIKNLKNNDSFFKKRYNFDTSKSNSISIKFPKVRCSFE